MSDSIKLEPAREQDVCECNEIINDGKAFQNEQGFTQWTENYPNIETIREDIKNKKGYVLKDHNKIFGYRCIDFDGEPAYADIQGEWHTKEPYAVIHRMAFSRDARGRGLSSNAFRLAEELCVARDVRNIRMDTDFPNKLM